MDKKLGLSMDNNEIFYNKVKIIINLIFLLLYSIYSEPTKQKKMSTIIY